MARVVPQGDKTAKEDRTPETGWAKLTWEDLEQWAGIGSVSRGRTYQRGARVKDLRVSGDGELLATVVGTDRYATTVSPGSGRRHPSLESACTCPVGVSCKHAVAAVAEYLAAVADGRDVPLAAEDDPRWGDIEGGGTDGGDDWDEDEDDAEEVPVSKPRRPARGARRGASPVDWDGKIQQQIRAQSQGELADLVWSLARRFPEIYQEFRERIALKEGDVDRLLAEARSEIRRVTAEPAWRNHWNDEGHTPDFSRIRHRFERLLELGHADEVVSLGREFIQQGLRQVGGSHDEGETARAFAGCLTVVFQAVLQSSLTGAERLLFAIDAELDDGYDAIGEASAAIIDAPSQPEDWSAVADTLAGRLGEADAGSDEDPDSFSRRYRRDRVTDWIATALQEAGRNDELRTLYETEARATGSYERLVAYLLETRRLDDAERWAREGVAATSAKSPGVAAHLAASLCELARKREQWDVVAAHAARPFFEHPSLGTFDVLVKAAAKAGVEDAVRAAALRFLETGAEPFQVISPRPAAVAAPRPRATGRRKAAPPAPPPSPPVPPRLKIDPSWPLPVPDYLVPLLDRQGRYDPGPRAHLSVLLDMAIAARRPDEALRWYDKMRSGPHRPGYYDTSTAYTDRVAAAVSATPPRAGHRHLSRRPERPAPPRPGLGLRGRRRLPEEAPADLPVPGPLGRMDRATGLHPGEASQPPSLHGAARPPGRPDHRPVDAAEAAVRRSNLAGGPPRR